MGGHRDGWKKGNTGRVTDSADDRAPVSFHQRPVSQENAYAYLALPLSRPARGTTQRHESSLSSTSVVAISGSGQHGRDPNRETPSSGQVWGASGMEGVPVIMVPAFLPQECLGTQVQGLRIQGATSFMGANHLVQARDQSRQVHDPDASMDMNKFPRASLPPNQQRYQQQKLQRGTNPKHGAEKHTSRHGDDSNENEQQHYQRHRAAYTTAEKSESKAKATSDLERGRSSWDEALDFGHDTSHTPRTSCSPSSEDCDTSGVCDPHEEKWAREAIQGWHVSHSPEAYEDKKAKKAAAKEQKWQRGQWEQRERADKFQGKARGGEGANLSASSPGTNKNYKKGYRPNQPFHNDTNDPGAQNKNPCNIGAGKKNQAGMPKASPARQNQQHHEKQFARRVVSSPGAFSGEATTAAAVAKNMGNKGGWGGGGGISQAQAHTPKAKAAYQFQQRQNWQRNPQASSGQHPRDWRTRTAPVQRRASYSPDVRDREVVVVGGTEEAEWEEEQQQPQTVNVQAKEIITANWAKNKNGSPKGNQFTKGSGWGKTGGDNVQNLIDI